MDDEFTVLGQAIRAGSRTHFRAPVGELNDGTVLTVPVIAVRGKQPGPVTMLSAGVHGDEYLGPLAIQQVMADLLPEEISGAVIGIPIMGPLAFLSRSRAGTLDYEHFNLNRLWPGDKDGFLTQRIAALLFEGAVAKSDFLLDYHEGGVALLARYLLSGGSESTISKVGSRQLEMAKWFGNGIPSVHRKTTDDAVRVGKLGNLIEAAGHIGIPAVSVELGGGGSFRPDLLEIAVAGTRRVLQGSGTLPGGPPEPDPEQALVRETTWLRPARGGLLIPDEDALLGARVEQGTRLACLKDAFGDTVEEITAPHDAIILDVRLLMSVYPGDWCFHLAKL